MPRTCAVSAQTAHWRSPLSVKAEGAILQRSGNTCVGSIALGEPLTPADPEISLRIYYAQAGEELFAIARRFHVSPAQMLAANDLCGGHHGHRCASEASGAGSRG